MSTADDLEPVLTVAKSTGLGVSREPFPESVIHELLARFYGLIGSLHPIPTEKDDTFLLESPGGRHLVKISSPHEEWQDIELQISAMLHVSDINPELPIQRPVPGRDGRLSYRLADVGHPDRVLRLLTYLPGQLLDDADPTGDEVADIGRMAGRVSLALRGFTHPRQERMLIWDLRWFRHMRPLLRHVGADAPLLIDIFNEFDRLVVPELDRLPSQVVHGDFSPYNVLVESGSPRYVKGVLDFGDVVHTALVFDVAVGMANLLCDNPDNPWEKSMRFLDGYLELRELSELEMSLLTSCAKARVALRMLMANWRAVEDPARRDYLLSHSVRDRANLSLAHAVSPRRPSGGMIVKKGEYR